MNTIQTYLKTVMDADHFLPDIPEKDMTCQVNAKAHTVTPASAAGVPEDFAEGRMDMDHSPYVIQCSPAEDHCGCLMYKVRCMRAEDMTAHKPS